MNIFYKPEIANSRIVLDPGESAHCIKVMRYTVGDHIFLIDGKGGYYDAEIVNDNYKACEINIVSHQEKYEPLPYKLNIAIAPTKSMDRFEWFVEKATEIGISSITPIICRRSERRNLRIDRIEKVIIAAMKQSVKAYLPEIHDLVRFDDWIAVPKSGTKLIAHCMDSERINIWQADLMNEITVLIGPEGDFTSEEVVLAVNNGFRPTSLGKYRLRTETAGLVACSAVYMNKGQA